MSGLDVAYISAELPGNNLHLMAILTLDPSTMPGGYSFENLRAFMKGRLPEIPPLKRKLVEVPFALDRPRWVEMDEVDLDLHVRRAALPSPGTAQQLSALAAEICVHPLDRSMPLWEIHVVEGLESGEIALIAKLHHAMMDGMVGVQYMAALLGSDDSENDRSGDEDEPGRESRARSGVEDARRTKNGDSSEPTSLQLLAEAVPENLMRPYRLTRAIGKTLFSITSGYVVDTLANVLTNKPAEKPSEDTPEVVVPHSIFNRRASSHRDVAYFKAPLARVKAVGRAFDATVNDVVLAMVGSAARRYLAARGELPAESLSAGIPASTHKKGGDDLANAYTVIFPTLATDLEDPAERLRAIVESSNRAKSVARPVAGQGLMSDWIDIPPPWLYNLLARAYVGFHVVERMTNPFFNLLVSSVPGPTIPLTFAGAHITGIHPLGPIYDGMLLNITALGRGETVDIGLLSCHEGVPGVWSIAEEMERALDELMEAVEESDIEADEEASVSRLESELRESAASL
jgi:WS/DGAT/MGAT family acyltransferase